MNGIIKELLKRKIPVHLKWITLANIEGAWYYIPGFYRSYGIWLYEIEGGLICIDDNDGFETITHLKDLVLLNFKWWLKSIDYGWTEMDSQWEQLAILYKIK